MMESTTTSTMTMTINSTTTSSRTMTTCTSSGAATVAQRHWYTSRSCFRNPCVLRSLAVRPNQGRGWGNLTTVAATAGPPAILTMPVTQRCATETELRSDCPDRIEGDPNSRLRVFCICPLPARWGGASAADPTQPLEGNGGHPYLICAFVTLED